MNDKEFKLFYTLFCIGLGMIIFSPTLAIVISFPSGEKFSEIYLMGPNHMAGSYPYNISPNKVYKIYLGVGNHVGGLTRYRVYVKFRNQTQPLPNNSMGTPSSLKTLFEYGVILDSDNVWEKEVFFSFSNASFLENFCRISEFALDDKVLSVDQFISWNATTHGFCCQMFFELWFYNITTSEFQYYSRFVGIWLNITATS